jgi:NitT/TauT family transport system substrate-binding protein
VRAVNKSLVAAIGNPKASVASLKARDGLVNLELENDRLLLMLRDMVVTPTTRAEGLGTVSPVRMKKTMQSIYDAYAIKTAPMPEKVYTDKFLPPKAERIPPAIGS